MYAQLRSAGQQRPRLPEIVAVVPGHRSRRPRAELTAAARGLAAELGAIADPSPRVCEAIDRVSASLELVAAGEVWPTDLGAGGCPATGPR